MRKKPKVRYVDMAIYVDAHIFDTDPITVATVHEYLVMLAYMLSIKRRFFDKEIYYDQYANYLAEIVYTRMTTPRQYLDESDPKYLSPIKSCLNYMKQILYARKCAFIAEEFNYTTKSDDEMEAFKAYATESALASTNDLLVCDIEVYLNQIHKIAKKYVYDGVYGNDKVLA